MERLLGELLAQRLMLVQLTAFIAAQEADISEFVSNLREATLRSLAASDLGVDGSSADGVREAARSIIEQSYDLIGRATDR